MVHLKQAIKIKKLIKSRGQPLALSNAERERQGAVHDTMISQIILWSDHPVVTVLPIAVPAAAAMRTSGKAFEI